MLGVIMLEFVLVGVQFSEFASVLCCHCQGLVNHDGESGSCGVVCWVLS